MMSLCLGMNVLKKKRFLATPVSSRFESGASSAHVYRDFPARTGSTTQKTFRCNLITTTMLSSIFTSTK